MSKTIKKLYTRPEIKKVELKPQEAVTACGKLPSSQQCKKVLQSTKHS